MTDEVLLEIERRWLEAAARSLKRLQHDRRDGDIYAAAFWLLYADAESLLCPAFAVNDESSATQRDPSDREVDVRWSPPDWRWSVVDDAVDSVLPLYAGVQPDQWQMHIDMLARVCKSITAHARAGTGGFHGLRVSDGFLCAIIDLAQGGRAIELVTLSVSGDVLGDHPSLVDAVSC